MPMESNLGRSVSVKSGTRPQPKCSLSNVHNEKRQFTTESKPVGNEESENTPLDDTMSEDSLLDSCADEDSSIDSEYVGYDRVMKRFERREKMLGRIVAGKSQFYEESIIAHEIASRLKTLQSVQRAHDASANGELTMNETLSPTSYAFDDQYRKSLTTDCNNPWSLQKLTLLFEGRHSLEGVWALCWYCTGHFGLFSIVEVLVGRALRLSQLSPHIFYSLLVLSALCVMRVNGYLWTWLASNSYRRVKFDMHNRKVLRFWDARILAVLRRPWLASLNRVISMLAFYMLFHGCVYFYNDVIIVSLKRVFLALTDDSTSDHYCTNEQNPPNTEVQHVDAQVDMSDPWISCSFLLFYIAAIALATSATAKFGGSVFTL